MKLVLSFLFVLTQFNPISAVDPGRYVSEQNDKGRFALSVMGKVTPLLISQHDYPGVKRALIKMNWQFIPNISWTGGGMTNMPVTAPSVGTPGGQSPRLEYVVNLADTGAVQVQTYLSPKLNFNDNKELRYAILVDNEAPQLVTIHAQKTDRVWQQSVANNIRMLTTRHQLTQPGPHKLKFWLVDPAVVVQQFVIDLGG